MTYEEIIENKGPCRIIWNSNCAINDIIAENDAFDENNKMLEVLPFGTPIHFISATFDFEELKYVYSFDVQQAVSTFIAAKMLLERFSVSLQNLDIDEKLKTIILQRTQRIIQSLSDKNEEFVLTTSDPDTLTISNGGYAPDMLGVLRRNNDSHISWKRNLEDIFNNLNTKIIIKLTEQVFAAYHNLFNRIPKYQERGYNIKDPKNVIIHTQYYMALYSVYISSNTILNQIAIKNCLLSGEKIDVIKAKTVKNWTKSLDLFRETAEIKIKDEKDEPNKQTATIEL
jgi:hypothetical protein